MSTSHFFTVATAAVVLLISGGPGAFAQRCATFPRITSLTTETLTYHGYSVKFANSDSKGKGTSTVEVTTVITECASGPGSIPGKRVEVHKDYTDGTGKSPFEERNPIPSTCEAIGSLNCP
jgi:hypothetical protein